MQMVVSLNYCSQNGGNYYRAPYYNGNLNIGPRIIGNLDQSPNDKYESAFELPNITCGSNNLQFSSKYPLILVGITHKTVGYWGYRYNCSANFFSFAS